MRKFKFGRIASSPAKLARRLFIHPKYLNIDELPMRPASVDYSNVGEPLGMMLNDSLGDCTCAGVGHATQVACWYGQKTPSAVKDHDVLVLYEKAAGYNPNDPNSDQGAELLDILNYWSKNPFVNNKLDAFVAFDPTNPDHWKAAVDFWGCAYIGVWLPQNVVDALESGQVIDWILTTDRVTQSAGHCVIVVGYDDKGLTVVTWGQTIKMSWAFAAKYCDEAYVLLMSQWASGNEPNNFNEEQLKNDLAQVQGGGVIPVDGPPAPPNPPVPPAPPAPPTPNPEPIDERIVKAIIKALQKAIEELEEL